MYLLKDAKRKLYLALLNESPDNLTDNDIDLGRLLAKDEQIQEILDMELDHEYNKCLSVEALDSMRQGLGLYEESL